MSRETERIIEEDDCRKKKIKNPGVYTVYRDLRLFINTLNNTVEEDEKKPALIAQVEQE